MTTVTGSIKFVDVPNDFCLTTIIDLIQFIQKNGKVEFDASAITNVVVSTDQPTDTSVIWFAISNSGNFIGVKVFVQSQWVNVFPAPSSLYRMYGNSTNIPDGYTLITSTTSGFTAGMVSFLQTQWLRDPTDTFWQIFDVVYIGL